MVSQNSKYVYDDEKYRHRTNMRFFTFLFLLKCYYESFKNPPLNIIIIKLLYTFIVTRIYISHGIYKKILIYSEHKHYRDVVITSTNVYTGLIKF